MAKAAAAEVQAGDRAVRVSSPDRVIYEATERTGEVTKLMVAEYFASVEDGLMRALRDRPTALERWPSGVREGMRLATGPQDRAWGLRTAAFPDPDGYLWEIAGPIPAA